MISYSTGENFSYDSLNNQAQGNDIALRQAFVEAGNVFQNIPEIRFWAGQRYYQRHDIHINDFYYLDMSGYGGGVEDVPLGTFAKLSLAWLGGSVDHYATDNGNVAKQNIDLRLSNIKSPGGKVTLWFDYANTKGGEVRDVFNADGSKFNVQSSGGWAVGLIHRTEDEKLFGGYNEFSISTAKARPTTLPARSTPRGRNSTAPRASASRINSRFSRRRTLQCRRSASTKIQNMAVRIRASAGLRSGRGRSTSSMIVLALRSRPASIGRRATRWAPMDTSGKSPSRRRFRAATNSSAGRCCVRS
jgi:maltoporin